MLCPAPQTGASLVPVYLFGETDVYMTLNHYLPFDSAVRRFQRNMEKAWGEAGCWGDLCWRLLLGGGGARVPPGLQAECWQGGTAA